MDEPDAADLQAKLAAAAADHGLPPPDAKIERLPDVDWVTRTQRAFPPIRAGRFFVHGSHYRDRPPAGAVALEIDAGIAFCSGEHATTRGCLLALDRLARRGRRPRRMLDLGCGSGILSIAAAKRWRRPVLAADIDRDSVRVAAENARRNGVSRRLMKTRWSDGLGRVRGRYDVACANILARPLHRLSRDLARVVAPGGTLVLSGLLISQAAEIVAVYRGQRLALSRRIALDGWQTLVFRRRAI